MSHFGLYSGWYAQLREFSELVDEVLLNTLGQPEPGIETSRARLAQLFGSLGGTPPVEPKMMPLRIWMSRHIQLSPSQWQILADSVARSSSDGTVIETLEQVARQLDLHRAQILHDMRGR
jgi:hypothetical protein